MESKETLSVWRVRKLSREDIISEPDLKSLARISLGGEREISQILFSDSIYLSTFE